MKEIYATIRIFVTDGGVGLVSLKDQLENMKLPYMAKFPEVVKVIDANGVEIKL